MEDSPLNILRLLGMLVIDNRAIALNSISMVRECFPDDEHTRYEITLISGQIETLQGESARAFETLLRNLEREIKYNAFQQGVKSPLRN